MGFRVVSGLMLTLLLVGMLSVVLDVPVVVASGTIYIRADGSIDPPTAPIQRDIVNVFSEPAAEWNKTFGWLRPMPMAICNGTKHMEQYGANLLNP